jgi:3',5'-cyclic AMP phosphodiesterase CpdA
MRIVHISDLHFGDHNLNLRKDLRRRLQTLKPDLILATGDLADSPTAPLFKEAGEFLRDLASLCQEPPAHDPNRPRLIVIPGNHDILAGGWTPGWVGKLLGSVDFYHSFADGIAQYYFRPENVWVFGFDSAEEGKYAGGSVRDRDIDLFHEICEQLRAEETFASAFKIAVVHHHPLPVNWDKDWRQRWLTMVNAGSFLGAVLHRGIDLVLHGHEHLQAHARLRSTLGGDNSGEMVVFSLGATLRNVTNPNRNWFSLLTIGNEGDVDIQSFGSQGQFAFADTPVRYVVRSAEAAKQSKFERWKSTIGFRYPHLASITLLNSDGDARRIVECELEILNSQTARAREHPVTIPYTSGDIQVLEVKGSMRSGVAGISIRENQPQDLTQRNHRLTRTIDFGKALTANETTSYQYSWWAVDAFAMDESQFDYKYADDRTRLEFTHLVIDDPIENLLLVVQFPEDFKLPDWPEIRVTKPDPVEAAHSWTRLSPVEDELNAAGGLRYIESLRTASLRISRPQRGLSYGIQWRVPSVTPLGNNFERGQIIQVVQLLLERKDRLSPDQSTVLLALLARIANIAREILLVTHDDSFEQWRKSLEVSLMVFDTKQKKLVTIKAARFVKEDEERLEREIDYGTVTFDYGDGVAGKAFKTNDYRLYVQPIEPPKVPNNYRKLPGVEDPWVLLSLPIRVPSESARPYGVMNLVSYLSDCPLIRLGESNSPVTEQDLIELREELDESVFAELTHEMLAQG